MNDIIKEKLKLLPNEPGCYLMKDKNGVVIYVGKAKILKNRVRSYFVGAHNAKTTLLVSEICDFDYIITASNLECLVLEINLIKQYDPKYNIMLTDDKTYPYILLTNERDPRLLVIRTLNKRKLNGKIFGPYPNVVSARKTVELLNRIYPLRKCRNIPSKECLYYHMHQCLAPCINHYEIDYTDYKKEIVKFLNGDTSDIINKLKGLMTEASAKLEFENAMEYRDLIEDIKKTTESQKISIGDLTSRDIFGIYTDDNDLSICVLYMRNGNIVGNYITNFPIVGDINDMVSTFILQFYKIEEKKPKEILIENEYYSDELKLALNIDIVVPQKGQKKEILEMAIKNAKEALDNQKTIYQNKVLRSINTIESLGRLLDIPTPYHIEAFDNSNLYGEYPVSGMVVYKNGKPSPKDYRKYHIKYVKGANDYETMKEVIYRRYSRLKEEKAKMPDLIVMDGGEIQVNACIEVLNSLNLDLKVMGIKKDNNHKANVIVYDNKNIEVSKNSDIYLLLANISQTVHDYAISFFRSTKAKGMFSSRLDGIKNLGPKRKEKLLKHFISIDNIKNATIDEIEALGFSENLALDILKHLNN
ncbi:MAG: excinuclease ABC subunit UvrC [Anaeroplasmataceae bacterium]